MHNNPTPKQWQRQKTTKLYLHPPRAERMITLWPDFKIVNSVVRRDARQGEEGHGFIILVENGTSPIPWQHTKFSMREDGIPIQRMEYSSSDFVYGMESFCSMDRYPVTYTRLTVRNLRPWKTTAHIGLLPRNGKETWMMGMNKDGYCTYEPMIEMWGMLPCSWFLEGRTIRNAEHAITIQSNESIRLDWIAGDAGEPLHRRHWCGVQAELEADGTLVLDLALNRGSGQPFDYDQERSVVEAAWDKELKQIKVVPLVDSPQYRTMFLHLVAQMLQMIVSHEGMSYTTVRQGGIERGIWPMEAVDFLVALDQIGLHDYADAAYDYFREYQIPEGEDQGRIPSLIAKDWANNTGTILWGLSQHLLMCKSEERFEHFREMLLAGYSWIERTRARTRNGELDVAGKGLFPPMSATDWGGSAQSWCWTDAWNLMGLEQLANVLEAFGDPEAGAVRAGYEDYRSIMTSILEELTAGHEEADEILIPNRLGETMTDPPQGPYYADGPCNLIRAGILRVDSPLFTQAENYFRNRLLMQNGLCGLMTDGLLRSGHAGDRWAGHTWYTTVSELPWFSAWLRRGEFDKAEETFQALMKYAISEEFQVSERYADNDPAFAPWQPNASGNGRVVMMMFEYFEAKAARGSR